MINYLFVSGKPWHDKTLLELKKNEKENWFRVKEKSEFNLSFLNKICPDKIIWFNSTSIYEFPDNRFDSVDLIDIVKVIEKKVITK